MQIKKFDRITLRVNYWGNKSNLKCRDVWNQNAGGRIQNSEGDISLCDRGMMLRERTKPPARE